MANVSRFGVNYVLASINARVSGKFCPNCIAALSGARFYRGSNRDVKRREWNKKMDEMKQQGPRKFDYKQFISKNYEKEITAFAHRLGLAPDNELLRQAFMHRSFESDQNKLVDHNGKLAVLGFNIASQIISSFLYLSYPIFPSYGYRNLQEYILSQEALVHVARSLSIPELIKSKYDLLSSDDITNIGPTKNDIIADSLLALIGAIHINEGASRASSFVRDFLIFQLYGQELEDIIPFKNPEMSLAALLRQQGKEKPVERLISSSGRHTETPVYVVGVFSSETLLAKVANPILERAKYQAYCSALTNVLTSNMPQPGGLPHDKTSPTPSI
ncbi:uncharacterized protein LOC114524052 [Dendronephthya gigantea]|uniref:uncharacterized protein LOC114524052 n=1 Tax=Dendronephthya gigantea TaxID=151771 RepID=UPI00106B72D6|nr:uncharacterized protein LOC114524052 [Dendronephthya gigantea]